MVLNLSFLWFTGFSDWEDDSVQQELPGDIATKTTLFKHFQAGLDEEFQIAMLTNLVSVFNV